MSTLTSKVGFAATIFTLVIMKLFTDGKQPTLSNIRIVGLATNTRLATGTNTRRNVTTGIGLSVYACTTLATS